MEGGGYEKIWLETQPMGGEMYFPHDPEAAFNNIFFFMEHQRADGRLPGSIALMDGKITPQFNKLQGFCFPLHAMNLYFLIGENKEFLQRLRTCLMRFHQWLWRTRDSDRDGLLESFCVYDTGEDNALRYGDAPCWWEEDAPPKGNAYVPMGSMDIMSFSFSCRHTLCRIARIKSQDMKDNRYFAHESPTFGRAPQMLTHFGYAYNGAGENIAHHSTAEKAEAAFMSSWGHRINILGKQWTKVGIGVVYDNQGYLYITQLFVR